MWPELMKYRVNRNSEEYRHALILDMEGSGSTQETASHDNKIFLMALLLSSLLIYNSLGVIDENAIHNLAFITKVS